MPLEARKIDPEFESEQAAVRLLGGKYAMFDFDLFKNGEVEEAFKYLPVLNEKQSWTYRGWMMTPELYEQFYNEMARRGYVLTNNPTAYSICHVYPLVYPSIRHRAVKTYCVEGTAVNHSDLIDFFGGPDKPNRKLFVKDWVKSAKGIEGATVVNDYTDINELNGVIALLKEERGDMFYFGLVFKEYVNIIKRPDGLDEEYRGFFVNDKQITWAPAHGPGGQNFEPPVWAEGIASEVPGDFFTLDFVFIEGKDGPEAIILEAGDGGVSGLSVGQMPITFYSLLETNPITSRKTSKA